MTEFDLFALSGAHGEVVFSCITTKGEQVRITVPGCGSELVCRAFSRLLARRVKLANEKAKELRDSIGREIGVIA